jgi:hypothetical protein
MIEPLALADNLARVQEQIMDAARRARRAAAEITLVAVSKGQPAAAIQAAYALGVRDFGESYIEEALPKIAGVDAWLAAQGAEADPIRWHLIGHVQSRKAGSAVGPFDLVHSVDRVKIAHKLAHFAQRQGRALPVLLEVNVSAEASKYGFAGNAVSQAVVDMAGLAQLSMTGLMTIAPIVAEPELARPVFQRLHALRESLRVQFPSIEWTHLSMGMTDDFEVAIEEGATLVRIGRAIFGER